MWLQLEQLVLSYPPLFARNPLKNIFLGQLELCDCVAAWAAIPKNIFSVLHFGTLSRLFSSSLIVLRAAVPGGMDLQLLLSEHLTLATPGQSSRCHQVPCPGCFPNTDQDGEEWWHIRQSLLFWLGANIPPKSALEKRQPWVLQAKTQLELSPLWLLCRVCVNVSVGCGTPLCVWLRHTYQLLCTHIWQNSRLWYGQIKNQPDFLE